jgi:hypothetical protein
MESVSEPVRQHWLELAEFWERFGMEPPNPTEGEEAGNIPGRNAVVKLASALSPPL